MISSRNNSAPEFLAPHCERRQIRRICWRVETRDRLAGPHAFRHEVLKDRHLVGFLGDRVGDAGGDHDHAVSVADDDVAREDRGVAAADRDLRVDRLVEGEVGGGGGALVERGEVEGCEIGRASCRERVCCKV